MRSFDLCSQFPPRVIYGVGAADAVAKTVAASGEGRTLVITDRVLLTEGVVDRVLDALPHGAEVYAEISGEPNTETVERVLRFCRKGRFAKVLGIGGGSVLDTAKLAAALNETRLDVSRVFGHGKIGARKTALALVPTTAGTGSEATPNAIIVDAVDGEKKAVISRHLVPDWVALDPALTVSLPPSVSASTGMDALCHCMESLVSVNANVVSDAYAYQGVRLIGASLEGVVSRGDDIELRGNMLLASFLGGLALTIAGTTAAHALSYPMGKRGAAHGVATGMLLPWVLEFNLPYCYEKLGSLAPCLNTSDRPVVTADDVVEAVFEYVRKLPVPKTLVEVGIPSDAIPDLSREALKNDRLLKNNPGPLTQADAESIYRKLLAGGVD